MEIAARAVVGALATGERTIVEEVLPVHMLFIINLHQQIGMQVLGSWNGGLAVQGQWDASPPTLLLQSATSTIWAATCWASIWAVSQGPECAFHSITCEVG